MKLSRISALSAACWSIIGTSTAEPLKIYILAGQSNMEGHAKIETFGVIGKDPATAPLLKEMTNPDGTPKVCDDVWISYFTGMGENNGEGHGKLTTGYGARGNPAQDGGKIGPEFTFGITMEKVGNTPALIIKTAWGGKSLHTDFRPPSAGPYELSSFQKEHYPKQEGHGIPKDLEAWKVEKEKQTGHYYREMIGHVKNILTDIKRVYPDYDPAQGHELAGFVWFQGWNDMVDSHVYPHNGNKPGRYDLYSELFAHFIRDVRKDLSAPELPFVIGVMGVGGPEVDEAQTDFRRAMAAPAEMPEFKGTVAVVETAPFWEKRLGEIEQNRGKIRHMAHLLQTQNPEHANKDGKMTDEEQKAYLKKYEAELITPEDEKLWSEGASNAGYHYFGSAKTMALIGQAFANALLELKN